MSADNPAKEKQRASLLQLIAISPNTQTHISGLTTSPILFGLQCIAQQRADTKGASRIIYAAVKRNTPHFLFPFSFWMDHTARVWSTIHHPPHPPVSSLTHLVFICLLLLPPPGLSLSVFILSPLSLLYTPFFLSICLFVLLDSFSAVAGFLLSNIAVL